MKQLQQTQESRLLLQAKCQNLTKICAKEAINPYLVVSIQSLNQEIFQVYRTNPVKNSFDPLFDQTICIVQPISSFISIIFQIYNNDSKEQLIGKSKLLTGELLKKPISQAYLTKNSYMNVNTNAKLIICRQILPAKLQKLGFQFSCKQINKSPWQTYFQTNCYFFRIYSVDSSKKILLYQSEKIMQQSYRWSQFQINQKSKSNTELQVQLVRQGKDQQCHIIGCGQLKIDCLNSLKEVIIKNKLSRVASLSIEKYTVNELQAFESYLAKGLKIKPIIGIDFTASNDTYTNTKSLHHIYKADNIYQKTVLLIYNALTPYSDSSSLPYYAIGTKVKHPNMYTGNKVQDCFPLNGKKDNHQIADFQEFNLEYKRILPFLEFSGPFKLNKILMQAKNLCERERKRGSFTVLVILNDGTVGDVEQAKKRLQQLSYYPFFLIALGVRQAEYKELKEIIKVQAKRTTLDGKTMRRKLAAFTKIGDKLNMSEVLDAMMCSIAQYMNFQSTQTLLKEVKNKGEVMHKQEHKYLSSTQTIEG